jgi:hypothetical protein
LSVYYRRSYLSATREAFPLPARMGCLESRPRVYVGGTVILWSPE